MDDIKAAVGRIRSFPGGAERPQFREMTNLRSVIRLIVYGDVPERSLKELAHQIEDELAALPDVSEVDVTGVCAITRFPSKCRSSGCGLSDSRSRMSRMRFAAARSISPPAASRPGKPRCASAPSASATISRISRDIIVLAESNGAVVRLGDIADVRDDFEETDLIVRAPG